jgi:hypothetical protein
MKWTTSQFRAWARLLYIGSVALLGAGLARADFIFVCYDGITPYHPDETPVFFPSSPAVLDRVRPDATRLGSGETIVDSGLGQIKTMFITAPTLDDLGHQFSVGPFTVNSQIDDTAHFTANGPGIATATIKFHIAGTGVLPSTVSNVLEYDTVAAVLQLQDGAHSARAQFANMSLEGYTVPAPNVPFPIDLLVTDSFSFTGTLDVPFNFLLLATGANGASLNLFDTAQLSFDLPPGVSVNTDGGFLQSGPAVVPEPSGLWLLGTGIVGLLGYGWRRKNAGS